ncbi:hypothetical protein [Bacillus sp. NSP9.1]|uniref:hypothetical protein n=1 Tax=Bacillus sp. NSP9.1 TaxID=1071078 RepID=UPI0004211FF3|nr:hypothetical protein [Bacillus sp. NSP9.1]QHZ47757.1 hypothetical protein M654_016365 [Bacillus sp. NSP9.1]
MKALIKTIQTNIVTNPNLLIIQSRLHNPNLYSSAKWIIFDAENKKSFLISNFKIISILTEASVPINIDDLLSYFKNDSQVTKDLIYKLIDLNIIRKSIPLKIQTNYTYLYQLSNFNYPFRDYSDPLWLEKDLKIMDQYKRHTTPPSIYRKVEGEPIFLKKPTLNDTVSIVKNGPINENFIANLLYLTLGKIGEIKGPTGPLLKRTSSSGGGRHPTEGILLIRKAIGNIKEGNYAYDTETHSLVKLDSSNIKLDHILPEGTDFSILFTVCPERAMWRYRDIRAFRPMLIDIGHVIETFKLLISKASYNLIKGGITEATEVAEELGINWMEEPAFNILHVGIEKMNLNNQNEIYTPAFLKKLVNRESSYSALNLLTNSFSWIKIKNGVIFLNIIYPEQRQLHLNISDLEVLTHCLPSQRGDRLTDIKNILNSVNYYNEDPEKRLYNLINNYGLIPESIAKGWYHHIAKWSIYGWYPSLLQHAHTITELSYKKNSSLYEESPRREFENLENSLMKRRTVREFENDIVTFESFKNIIDSIFPIAEGLSLNIYIVAFNITKIKNGCYKIINKDDCWQIKKTGISLNRKEFQDLAIGQYPASAGAFNILMINEMDGSSSKKYEEQFISLGKLGQRICLTATREELGVFLTPAVKDKALFKKLGITQYDRCATYLFSIGVPKGER